ncbi:MAG: hypothetical protein JNL73_12180 [Anaerolineales bacterium]|nr:hypothetical protein [Anaerolineales bacterium]
MAVVRCPQCNKPNPDFLDLCQYCDTPLRAGPAQPAAQSATPPPETNPAAASWDAVDPEAAPAAETPDANVDADLPEWVTALASDDAAPAAEPTALPDWFSSLRTEDEPVAASQPQPFAEPDEPVSGQALPAWFDNPEAQDAPVDAPQPALPDWLSAMTTDAPGGDFDAPAKPASAPLPEWLEDLTASQPERDEPAAPAEAAPAWLGDLTTAPTPPAGISIEASGPAIPPIEPPLPPREVSDELAAGDAPDWLQDIATAGVAAGALADFTDDDPILAPQPAAPADDGEAPAARPAWTPAEDEPAPISGDDLSQGDLPPWLAAMRPTDVQGAPANDETPSGESDSYEEAIGVLAGMRGVLRAEPSVVLPGKAASNVHALTVTESQNKAAQVLAALARAEVGPATAKKKRRFELPLVRWLVAALLMLAAVLPYWAPGLLSDPAALTVGSETALAAQAVEDLGLAGAARRPVLLVIDYEPGQAAELSPAAAAFTRHVLRLGLPVVALSTTPSSAGVAEQVVTQSAQEMSAATGFSYDAYTYFVNLGYLPGGSVGVVQFAYAPRQAFLSDFSGRGRDLWDQPALDGIQSLSDFGALLIVSGSPEGARAWLEQTATLLPADRAVVIAASAGAGPLLRPYLTSNGGTVDGLVSGLSAAAQYERQAGLSGAATARWSLTGGVLLAAAAIILIGNLLAGLSRLRIRR